MEVQHFNFESEVEALAFIRGIQCVGDESVEIEGMTLSDDALEWTVTVVKHDDAEACGRKYCECE
jgi:hypothetical protein